MCWQNNSITIAKKIHFGETVCKMENTVNTSDRARTIGNLKKQLIALCSKVKTKEVLAIRRIFSLVDMITNTKFSNCPNVLKIGVVQQ